MQYNMVHINSPCVHVPLHACMHAGCEVDLTDISGNGPLALLEKYSCSHDVTSHHPLGRQGSICVRNGLGKG